MTRDILMDDGNLMDAPARPRCTAKSKRSGVQCKRAPAIGRAVCAMHGGKTPVGPASPHWRDGRHSKVLPKRLLDRYLEALADPERLSMNDELAVVDARLSDVLGRVDSGESGTLWRELRKTYRVFATARRVGEIATMQEKLFQLGTLIETGDADWTLWSDIRSLIRDRQRLADGVIKRKITAAQMIGVEQAMTLLALLVDSVRREVRDPEALRAVTAEFARLTGLPSPTDADDQTDFAA